MSGCEEHPRWRANEPLFLHLIDIKEGGELPLRVVSDDGVTSAHFRCRRAEARSRSRAMLPQRVQLACGGVRSVHEDIDNGALAGIRPHEVHIDWTNTKKPILIKLTEDGGAGSVVVEVKRGLSKPKQSNVSK